MSALIKEALPKPYDTDTLYKEDEHNHLGLTKILMSRMTDADIAEVHALESRAYSFPWSRLIFSDCINSRYECWMMRRSDKVIAYGIMAIAINESHLLNLCVDSDFRRQGYACYMVRFLSDISIVQNAKRMLLEVRASNYQAFNLYRKLGFQQIGLRRNYYPAETDREDARVLAKLL